MRYDSSGPSTTDDQLREIERARLRALVAADLDAANQLHADDFQLITPAGAALSKQDYLGGIASGAINYQVWQPEEPIAVRIYGDAAVIRYRAHIDIIVDGEPLGLHHTWHTDVYEKRAGSWQVAWSHATIISEE
jgi:hypothetical protein